MVITFPVFDMNSALYDIVTSNGPKNVMFYQYKFLSINKDQSGPYVFNDLEFIRGEDLDLLDQELIRLKKEQVQ